MLLKDEGKLKKALVWFQTCKTKGLLIFERNIGISFVQAFILFFILTMFCNRKPSTGDWQQIPVKEFSCMLRFKNYIETILPLEEDN